MGRAEGSAFSLEWDGVTCWTSPPAILSSCQPVTGHSPLLPKEMGPSPERKPGVSKVDVNVLRTSTTPTKEPLYPETPAAASCRDAVLFASPPAPDEPRPKVSSQFTRTLIKG